MKILLIAGSRVGGTKIGEWLGYELGIEYIHEPFGMWRDEDGKQRNKVNVQRDNIIVKVFPGMELERVLNTQKDWNKIIGIVRNDIRECGISIVRAEETNEWHNGYEITKEWISEREGKINDAIQRVGEWNNRIKENPIIECMVSYEGIYNTEEDRERLREYLNISRYRFDGMLNPKYRYRRDETNPTPIQKSII